MTDVQSAEGIDMCNTNLSMIFICLMEYQTFHIHVYSVPFNRAFKKFTTLVQIYVGKHVLWLNNQPVKDLDYNE